MAEENPYLIEIQHLKQGSYDYAFTLDDSFFPDDAERVVEGADVWASVRINKSSSLIDVRIRLKGHLTLACDRCLRTYPHPLEDENRVVYSYDPSLQDADADDVVYISREQTHLDLQQDLLDFLSLQAPLRRIPPDCPGPGCPPEVLRLLEQTALAPETEADPRWAGLSALKDVRPDPHTPKA